MARPMQASTTAMQQPAADDRRAAPPISSPNAATMSSAASTRPHEQEQHRQRASRQESRWSAPRASRRRSRCAGSGRLKYSGRTRWRMSLTTSSGACAARKIGRSAPTSPQVVLVAVEISRASPARTATRDRARPRAAGASTTTPHGMIFDRPLRPRPKHGAQARARPSPATAPRRRAAARRSGGSRGRRSCRRPTVAAVRRRAHRLPPAPRRGTGPPAGGGDARCAPAPGRASTASSRTAS